VIMYVAVCPWPGDPNARLGVANSHHLHLRR
jgi:hypothetical protein